MSMHFESNGPDDDLAASGSSGPPWKLIALVLVVAAAVTFFLQNGEEASVEFLWLDFRWPLWAVIGISILAGVLLDRLGGWQWRRSRRGHDGE